MSSRSIKRGAPGLLFLSLLANVAFVSCASDAMAPVPQQDNATVLAELAAIRAKVDSIDARTQRIDASTTAMVDSIVAAFAEPSSSFTESLADAISLSAEIGVSAQVCAELGGALGAEITVGPDGEVDGHVEAGPNVVEAEAQVRARARLKAEVAAKAGVEGALKGSICAGAGGALGVDLEAVADAMRSQLAALGINGSSVSTLVAQVGGPSTANYDNTVSSIRSALPVPSGINNVLDQPASILSTSPRFSTFANEIRCDPSVFPAGTDFAAAQTRLCALTLPSAERYIGILNGLDGLPSTVSNLESRLSTVCGGVNALIPQRITIASRTITILGTDYLVFPGYSARLFPGRATLDC